jgi:hypothetical protein
MLACFAVSRPPSGASLAVESRRGLDGGGNLTTASVYGVVKGKQKQGKSYAPAIAAGRAIKEMRRSRK